MMYTFNQMQRFRVWLRGWLGIVDPQPPNLEPLKECIYDQDRRISIIQSEIRELRAEVTRLAIAQYIPPQQPEPERRIIKTQTTKQYLDILEREFELEEARDAS